MNIETLKKVAEFITAKAANPQKTVNEIVKEIAAKKENN